MIPNPLFYGDDWRMCPHSFLSLLPPSLHCPCSREPVRLQWVVFGLVWFRASWIVILPDRDQHPPPPLPTPQTSPLNASPNVSPEHVIVSEFRYGIVWDAKALEAGCLGSAKMMWKTEGLIQSLMCSESFSSPFGSVVAFKVIYREIQIAFAGSHSDPKPRSILVRQSMSSVSLWIQLELGWQGRLWPHCLQAKQVPGDLYQAPFWTGLCLSSLPFIYTTKGKKMSSA